MNKNEDSIIKVDGKITKYKVIKKSTKIGSGCHIILPIGVTGREFKVEMLEKKEKNGSTK